MRERKRRQIISAFDRRFGTDLIRKEGVYFLDARRKHRIICSVSKRYEGRRDLYWYRYEQNWHDFLQDSDSGYLVLGCMDILIAFAIPAKVIGDLRVHLNATMVGNQVGYWHLNIIEPAPGHYALAVP